jgi:hemolysin activation/secretion protein
MDVTGTIFPALWDVKSVFGAVAANAAAYFTIPSPLRPIIVLRGGGEKVFGDFPFHESAFLGGHTTLRTLDAQRYAGDASIWGSAELRVPLARFPLIVPLDLGMFGLVDAGRVYVSGDSPGGWHTAAGVGFWIGILDPSTSLRICRQIGGHGPC